VEHPVECQEECQEDSQVEPQEDSQVDSQEEPQVEDKDHKLMKSIELNIDYLNILINLLNFYNIFCIIKMETE
jgi:hypothetical protein